MYATREIKSREKKSKQFFFFFFEENNGYNKVGVPVVYREQECFFLIGKTYPESAVGLALLSYLCPRAINWLKPKNNNKYDNNDSHDTILKTSTILFFLRFFSGEKKEEKKWKGRKIYRSWEKRIFFRGTSFYREEKDSRFLEIEIPIEITYYY